MGRKFSEAPVFYWLYTILIVAGAGVILVPNLPLVKITILSQVVNGVVLPFVLVFMLLLVNKKELMGEYVNSRLFNVIAWATTHHGHWPDLGSDVAKPAWFRRRLSLLDIGRKASVN